MLFEEAPDTSSRSDNASIVAPSFSDAHMSNHPLASYRSDNEVIRYILTHPAIVHRCQREMKMQSANTSMADLDGSGLMPRDGNISAYDLTVEVCCALPGMSEGRSDTRDAVVTLTVVTFLIIGALLFFFCSPKGTPCFNFRSSTSSKPAN